MLIQNIKRLIIIGLSAFFIVACKDEGGILLPNQQEFIDTRVVDTFTLEMSSILWENEINTSNAVYATVGDYTDPITGHVRAYSCFNLSSSEEYRDFGTGPICDSIFLILPYGALGLDNTVYPVMLGDSTSNLELEVFELTGTLVNGATYRPSDSIPMTDVAIGSYSGNLYPRVSDLKIYLGKSFGQKILQNGSFLSQDQFRSVFKGLSVKAKPGTDGAVYSFNISTTDAYLRLFYSNAEAIGFSFDMYFSNASLNHIEADRSGTDIASLVNDGDKIASGTSNSTTFLQGGTGVNTLVSFDGLNEFFSSNPNLAINKALLVLPVDINSFNDIQDRPPLYINLVKVNKQGQYVLDSDGNPETVYNFDRQILGSLSSVFEYDFDNDRYACNITSFVQDLALGKETFNGFAVKANYDDGTVNRAVLLDQTQTKGAYFKLYYTVIE